jgi:hypothetical protein
MCPKFSKTIGKINSNWLGDGDYLPEEARPEIYAKRVRVQSSVHHVDPALIVRYGKPTIAANIKWGELLRGW